MTDRATDRSTDCRPIGRSSIIAFTRPTGGVGEYLAGSEPGDITCGRAGEYTMGCEAVREGNRADTGGGAGQTREGERHWRGSVAFMGGLAGRYEKEQGAIQDLIVAHQHYACRLKN